MSEGRRIWNANGASKSSGEGCGFSVAIEKDGSGWIGGWAEYATDNLGLDLSREQIAALIRTLTGETP